jgi:hypothetical protein
MSGDGSKSSGRSSAAINADGDSARALALLLRATKKFQDRFHESVRARDTTWHRLAVKVDRGRIVSIQLILDESVDVPKPDADEREAEPNS